MNLEQLVASYGYLAIFLGTFLEGETILVVAGFLAHRGYLELHWVILAAFLGTLFGDQLYFHIGRRRGFGFIEAKRHWKARASRVFRLLREHQVLLILGFRFIYGIRTVTPFVLGASGIGAVRYFVLNVVGAGVWAVIISILGYFVGQAAQHLLDEVKRYELWIIFGIFTAGALVWIIYRVSLKRRTTDKPDNH